LMDQSMIAGLGNVYVDEILFQCRIHPKAKVKDLSGKDYKKLFNIMHKVVDKAIEVDADPDKLPTSYLTGKRREGEKCPSCDGKIEKIKVGGRSGYYCPECQKR
ncbi:MAG: zinc finger domain-containing protein, partial [Bacteroidota bacterium]